MHPTFHFLRQKGRFSQCRSVEVTFGIARVFLVLSFFFSKFINETDVTEWLYHVLPHKCQERQKNPNNFKEKKPKESRHVQCKQVIIPVSITICV